MDRDVQVGGKGHSGSYLRPPPMLRATLGPQVWDNRSLGATLALAADYTSMVGAIQGHNVRGQLSIGATLVLSGIIRGLRHDCPVGN